MNRLTEWHERKMRGTRWYPAVVVGGLFAAAIALAKLFVS